jgi:hypothetical protein
MSHIANDKWLEAAYENFQEALESGNYALCKDIIADTQEAGFLEAGRIMNTQLRDMPISKFNPPSPYQHE